MNIHQHTCMNEQIQHILLICMRKTDVKRPIGRQDLRESERWQLGIDRGVYPKRRAYPVR